MTKLMINNDLMKDWFKEKLEEFKDDPEFVLEQYYLCNDEMIAIGRVIFDFSPAQKRALEHYTEWLKLNNIRLSLTEKKYGSDMDSSARSSGGCGDMSG